MDIKKIYKSNEIKKRLLCATPAPPEGLYLMRVIY